MARRRVQYPRIKSGVLQHEDLVLRQASCRGQGYRIKFLPPLPIAFDGERVGVRGGNILVCSRRHSFAVPATASRCKRPPLTLTLSP